MKFESAADLPANGVAAFEKLLRREWGSVNVCKDDRI